MTRTTSKVRRVNVAHWPVPSGRGRRHSGRTSAGHVVDNAAVIVQGCLLSAPAPGGGTTLPVPGDEPLCGCRSGAHEIWSPSSPCAISACATSRPRSASSGCCSSPSPRSPSSRWCSDALPRSAAKASPTRCSLCVGFVVWTYFSSATVRAQRGVRQQPGAGDQGVLQPDGGPGGSCAAPARRPGRLAWCWSRSCCCYYGVVPTWRVLAVPVWLALLVLTALRAGAVAVGPERPLPRRAARRRTGDAGLALRQPRRLSEHTALRPAGAAVRPEPHGRGSSAWPLVAARHALAGVAAGRLRSGWSRLVLAAGCRTSGEPSASSRM